MDFFQKYFVEPITNPSVQGYNLVNTIIFIIILIIACIIIYKLLNKKIKFNSNFFIAIIPYIFFGVSLRVIMHQIEAGKLFLPGIIKTANPLELGFWFFTPGIWVLTFTMVIIGLLIGKIWKKLDYKKVFYFGVIITIIPFIFNLINYNNWFCFLMIVILIIIITTIVTKTINKYAKYKILDDKLNYFIVLGQAIDSIASTIAITFFSFTEQHVFSNILIKIHPILFIMIKLFVAILLCWSLDDFAKETKNKNKIGFIKIIIIILGLATGLGSLLKLGII
ncbi:MAG: DUF63 family protein [Candidatus ainarchaeum sp.]|nr:DUF63 family protein [Candidatus ainarchaeum sp.]